MSRHDVIIVGSVAPPFGGVSAHVERLSELLEENGLRVGILNHFGNVDHPLVIGALKRNPVRYWWHLRRLQAPVVHYHHARWSTLLATGLARRSRRSQPGTWIVTIHGHDVEQLMDSRVPGVAFLSRWAVAQFDELVAVSDAVAEAICRRTGRRAIVIPAYLPHRELGMRNRVEHRSPTMIVSAYRVAANATQDLYGLDIAGEVFANASLVIPDLRLEVFLAHAPSGFRARRYLRRILAPTQDAVSEGRVTVHVGTELHPALRPGAVYVRPTRTDGDAVSIREALDCAVPVLASDVVARPEGVTSLPVDDTQAWVEAICDAISRAKPQLGTLRHTRTHAEAMISLYREVLTSVIAPTATRSERSEPKVSRLS